ncbi:MAG TPA: divergent polysaccharide deacetylase family protein [Rhizomicrobium sp.]|jgi:polysaccharide deacetylase 2 family uncharacterized protein YibQ|nr:divergent polysaccharide deacetylase family protein [Rhizomicrobium sp.]
MHRLKPIPRERHRGPSKRDLHLADGAFWVVSALVVLLSAGRIVAGVPRLAAMMLPNGLIAAEASVTPPHRSVEITLPPTPGMPAGEFPRLRPSEALREDASAPPLPAVAIVIDDLGADAARAGEALALPAAVALSFLPYPAETPELARRAILAGHEVLVHVPMEALDGRKAGPMPLTMGLTAGEIRRRLAWSLSRVPGFAGINNHEGSRFTASPGELLPVVEELASRHVFFFDSRTTAMSSVVSVARAHGVASAARDVFLDDRPTAAAVDAQLRVLERRAAEQGIAIAIGHPHEATLRAVAGWARNRTGFALVPLAAAIRLKTERESLVSLALPSR